MFQLVILYAGETGNSEDLCKRLTWEANRRNVNNVKSSSFDDWPLVEFGNEDVNSNRFFLFICSTTGQGDTPANGRLFWKRLMRRSLPGNALSSVNCAVIGLGDSSYLKYNVIGKKLYKRLKQLGANLVLEPGLGDDQHDHGYDAGVDLFLNNFWSQLQNFSKQSTDQVKTDGLPPPTFEFQHAMCGKRSMELVQNNPPFSEENPFKAEVVSNERVTSGEHFQDVRLIKLKIDDNVIYEPGDVVMVKPKNSQEDVGLFIEATKLFERYKHGTRLHATRVLDNVISRQYKSRNPVLLDSVKEDLDIHSIPKRSFFELLSLFADNANEKQKLSEFASTTGQEALVDYCLRPKRTIVEVLNDFPHTACKIPVDYMYDLIPAIKPRAFSIASARVAHNNQLHILMAVVNFKTRLKKDRIGLCSNFLANRQVGKYINVWIQKGTFTVPRHDQKLIMIGPGTGVAPFRSIIYDRLKRGACVDTLYFGCRCSKHDHYFFEEWEMMKDKLNYYVAFSREAGESESRVYVQHKMYESREKLADMILNQNAVILIAGSSNQMPQGVREMLLKIITEVKSMSDNDAETFVASLESQRRLQYECWS